MNLLDKIDQLLSDSKEDLTLKESIVVNGKQYIPKGTIIQIVEEKVFSKKVDTLLDLVQTILYDTKKAGVTITRQDIIDIVSGDMDDDEEEYNDEDFDQVFTELKVPV